MPESDVQTQLMELQNSLNRLAAEKQAMAQAAVKAPAQAAEGAEEEPELPDWLADLAKLDREEALAKLATMGRDWLGELDQDLKSVKPSTLLLIFSLGVALGKLTN
jgi:hypothetical protein